MSILAIRPASECLWDEVSLGEVMLRLDPGDARIHTARSFTVWEGGGEYNVARGLRRCFGLRTALVSAFTDNPVGRLLEDLILQGGVDMRHVVWRPFDGLGREARNGLNFTERGFGVRGAVGCSDRGHTAASQLKPGDVDWEAVFRREGARWFHCGGIFAAIGEHTPEVALEAMQCAKANGTVVSYDLNFRPSLWKAYGGSRRAIEVNRSLAPFIDVMIGNEEDFTKAFGFEVPDLDEHCSKLDPANFRKMIARAVAEFPNLKAVATTLRAVKTATVNDWGAILYAGGEYCEAKLRPGLEILDRVGGGDSFASGLIYGFLAGKGPAEAVEYGAAHGALAMTTPGDTSMATRAEVEALVKGGSARVQR
ncbi:MAG: 2-dehydro-3-deoxygluconokinase [Lentisphaerae bacterium ADurb.BinA184]|nr:MAG: 2-dehydro-3-deoxygluconokinase [Lentisphaerae bacterium ADurb.BinA184]